MRGGGKAAKRCGAANPCRIGVTKSSSVEARFDHAPSVYRWLAPPRDRIGFEPFGVGIGDEDHVMVAGHFEDHVVVGVHELSRRRKQTLIALYDDGSVVWYTTAAQWLQPDTRVDFGYSAILFGQSEVTSSNGATFGWSTMEVLDRKAGPVDHWFKFGVMLRAVHLVGERESLVVGDMVATNAPAGCQASRFEGEDETWDAKVPAMTCVDAVATPDLVVLVGTATASLQFRGKSIAVPAGREAAVAIALDREDGSFVWSWVRAGDPGTHAEAATAMADGRVLVVTKDGTNPRGVLASLDASGEAWVDAEALPGAMVVVLVACGSSAAPQVPDKAPPVPGPREPPPISKAAATRRSRF